jgi:hypothetical protein
MLTSALVLLHNNVRLLTTVSTIALLEYFNWELFDHHLYSHDIAPIDYHMFTYLTK